MSIEDTLRGSPPHHRNDGLGHGEACALGDIVSTLVPALSVERGRETTMPVAEIVPDGKRPAGSDSSVRSANATGAKGSFFAIDHRCWAKACELGMNAAVAYLLHARGTGRDQRTSSWSVQAMETYTGVSRSRAKAAIKALQSEGLTSQTKGGSHPRYWINPWSAINGRGFNLTSRHQEVMVKLEAGEKPANGHRQSVDQLVKCGFLDRGDDGQLRLAEPQWIWLPNEFVTGAADETPPLESLRQSQDVMALRLAADLYRAQNLREDGGVSRTVTYQKYERFEVGRQAQFTVWGFRENGLWVRWGDTAAPHYRDEKSLTDEEKKAGKNPGVDFFGRMQVLADIGVIEWIPHLVESDDDEAEIIHPLAVGANESERLENRLGAAAHRAASGMLTDRQRDWAETEGLTLVPVPKHLTRVQVIGIARLRYRPKTSLTAAWWAELQNTGEQFVGRYREMIPSSFARRKAV